MPRERTPLLTVAIPTYNRAGYLRELLGVLLPQSAEWPQVDVLVCDNASADETPQVCAEMREKFGRDALRVVRHAENIGADRNFAACFREAGGTFFWICGDDDIIVPGALSVVMKILSAEPELDIIYATSYGFREDFLAERVADPAGRRRHTYRSARQFARAVNIMFTFISGIIVNRARMLELGLGDPEPYLDTNLVQLAWAVPLLTAHRKSLVLWTRPVAARQGNAHGYALGTVFGEKLVRNLERLLPGRRDLQRAIVNPTLRRWFPSVLIDVRSAGNRTLRLDEAHISLRRTFGGNWRYWVFVWPALVLPLPLARGYTKFSALLSKGLQMVRLPRSWQKET